ncbi:hypothetical protein NBG84_28490 [Streptomyces sp. CWNU-1]|uniref:Secreted protein n=2 Tax=Streptomyces albipurpureus TaxID=2897419 RepID=A0ABT0UUB6_9ACTN|nr:hypothetical protein [Streptomyces sp. CWNU-1]
MAPMRRGLVHAIAWSLSTGAAVTLSWWGVHTVMSGTAYDRPLALPIKADTPTTQGSKPQESVSKNPSDKSSKPARPSSHDTPYEPPTEQVPAPSYEPTDEKPTKSVTPSASSEPAGTPTTSDPSSDVQAYTVDGGRVVFDMTASSAELASATPNAGWKMEVWKQDYWIRVSFTKDDKEAAVICTWYETTPTVQFYNK